MSADSSIIVQNLVDASELFAAALEVVGGLTSVYAGTCPACGRQWSVSFSLPASPPPADRIGGAEPSAVIDPGEWLWLAEQDANVPASGGLLSPGDRTQLGLAADELDEVVKFIPPAMIASLTTRSPPGGRPARRIPSPPLPGSGVAQSGPAVPGRRPADSPVPPRGRDS